MAKRFFSPKTHFNLPYSWNDSDEATAEAISQQKNESSGKRQDGPWIRYTQAHPSHDFLGDLVLAGVIDIEIDWAALAHQTPLLRNRWDNQNIHIVSQAHEQLNTMLHDGLLRLLPSGISREGGFLYYTDRLDRCIVYKYEIPRGSNRAVKVTPLVDIDEPDILYDIDSALSKADHKDRAALKNALVYGHKIVAHRNTIIHLDRRRDDGTEGPFIDTLILNEMFHKYIYEHLGLKSVPVAPFATVLEVGSGSGFLIASFAQNVLGIKHLLAVDPVMNAVHCTYRNVQINCQGVKSEDQRQFFTCGVFEPKHFQDCDAVICNPPYIPRRPDVEKRAISINPIAGTELLEELISSANSVLSDNGMMFLVYSSMARS